MTMDPGIAPDDRSAGAPTQPAAAPQTPYPPAPAAQWQVAPVKPARGLAVTSVALAIAALIATGGIGFAAGRFTAPAPAATGRTGFGNGTGFPNAGSGGNGFPGAGAGGVGGLGGGTAIKGTVTAVAADHITLKLASGTTIDIPVNGSTTYHRQASASGSDVAIGGSVEVLLTRRTGAAPDPNASPAPGGVLSRLGEASDVTVLTP
jgi:hypothetical protein